MPDKIKSIAADVEVFTRIEGSQTSGDGHGFALHARREDGCKAMLVFPHSEISNIVENAAMQLEHGRDDDGLAVQTAFNTSSYRVGQGPKGEMVLTLVVGKTGTINFLMPTDMAHQLNDTLRRALIRH
jgi:hypothetical protein